jgi:hypothetical protein
MELPTLDSLITGASNVPVEGKTEEPTKSEQTKEENLDRIDREQRHRREMYKAQQRIKELESRNNSDKTGGIDPDSKSPFKDLAKARGMSQDDVVRLALEAMDDDLTQEEKKEDMSKMTPAQIAELVKKQLKEEQEASEKEKAKTTAETQAIENFKKDIVGKADELAEKFPLVSSLGGVDSVYKLIEDKFNSDSKEYGEEYAQENMMKVEDAIKKTNETLALSVKDALKSKHLREFLIAAIRDESGELEDQSNGDEQLKENKEVTLNNRDFSARTEPAVKPQFRSSDEELDFLINKFI